jgi:hypothetical protein
MIDPFHVALAAVSLVFIFIVSTQFFTITSDVKLGVVTAADDTYKAMTRAFLLLTNAFKIATMIGVFNIFNQLIFKGNPSAFAHSTLWGMTGTFCLLLFTISGFLTWTLASNKLEKHDDAIKYHTEKRIMSPTDKFAVLKDICHMASVACALAIENATSFSFGHDMESLWWYAVLLTLFSMGMVIFIGYFQSFFRRFFVRSLCCYKRGSTEEIFEETKRTTANMLVFLIVTMLTWSLGFAYTHAFKATVIAQGADTKTETCSDWACFLGLLVISLGVLHYQHAACRRDALKRKEDGIVHSPEIENNFGYTSFCYSVFCNSVLMYTTNFSLHDAVYQTVSHFSGGSREHATPNVLIFAATVVAFTGGVVAYIVQKEATKIDDPSVTMTNFYDDCTKVRDSIGTPRSTRLNIPTTQHEK